MESDPKDTTAPPPGARRPAPVNQAEPATTAVVTEAGENHPGTADQALPTRAEPAPAGGTPGPAEPPEGVIHFWIRPLLLGAVVLFLLALTYWDQRRVPNSPLRPDVLTATPPSDATVSASDPGLADVLARLRTAVVQRDARRLANLADPSGVVVAAYGGGLPVTGVAASDTGRLAQDVLGGAQVSMLGWRNDGGGRVIVLSDGWPRKTLRLGPSGTQDLTSLMALGLESRAGTWYWRWLLPDASGVLAQQARSLTWQPWPAG